MKKRRLKKWVKKLLTILIVYLIGFGCIVALAYNAKKIDNNEVVYEKINK